MLPTRECIAEPMLKESVLRNMCTRKVITTSFLLVAVACVVLIKQVTCMGIASGHDTITMASPIALKPFKPLLGVSKHFKSFRAASMSRPTTEATSELDKGAQRQAEETRHQLALSCSRRHSLGLACLSLFTGLSSTPRLTRAAPSTDFADERRRAYDSDKKKAAIAAGPCEEACFQECNDAAPGNDEYCRSSCASECAKVDSMDDAIDSPVMQTDGRNFGAKKVKSREKDILEGAEKVWGSFLKPRM
eukprot:gnl/MRDRNA2_/MRDRNA2_36249_c0_seq2.p1 gnl/MRDRNA2_/MRDRNA2_36249_c0~~gnl/MRDRNA2_/MRDRNA2_36249_c0_seq2.p1  ORF type:complete len:248 (+),score=40.19 gnl/MRDRNA2_/MRDRNA2_36249_c0_seq2:149-892(+)